MTLVFAESEDLCLPPKYPPCEGECVFVLPDTRYDLSVVTRDKSAETYDVIRGIQAYMCGVCGFPPGEYDISVNGKKISYIIKNKFPHYFGGNIGKCKLLSANCRLNSSVYPITFSEMLCAGHLFRVSECHAVSNFDIAGVGAIVCMETTKHEPPEGFIALERTADEYKLCFYRFGSGVALPPSPAISAAAGFAYAMHKEQRISAVIAGDTAIATVDEYGIASLYTKDFSAFAIEGV